jgi:bifunctional DNA-binding transcriptional regulator/antitoxin component of YhaV-PrlF toxin-antitoxin module
MQPESAVARVDNRGRLQLPGTLRKALNIKPGGFVRVLVEPLEINKIESNDEAANLITA